VAMCGDKIGGDGWIERDEELERGDTDIPERKDMDKDVQEEDDVETEVSGDIGVSKGIGGCGGEEEFGGYDDSEERM
jgi:hypothetical protein